MNIKITTFLFLAFGIISVATAVDIVESDTAVVAQPVLEKQPEQLAVVDPNESPVAEEQEPIIVNPFNQACAGVLNGDFIAENGTVDYKLLRRKRSDLYDISRSFKTIDIEEFLSWELEIQVAFWINVHNICTLELVIDNYPIQSSRFKLIFYPAKSVMQISGARDSNYFEVMGREYSLEEIEANILELYGDPRVLFALNYAAVGSAPLRSEPYNGPMLEQQLDNQVRRFLGRRTGFYIDGSKLYLSPIFDWHIDRFFEYYGTNVRYRAHSEETRAIFHFIEQFKGLGWSRILESKKFKLRYQRFDWRLNGE